MFYGHTLSDFCHSTGVKKGLVMHQQIKPVSIKTLALVSSGRHLHDSVPCNVTETFPGNSANIRLRVWLASIPQIRGEFNTLVIDSSWKSTIKITSVPSRCLWRRLGICRYSELVRGGQRAHTKHFYVKFLCWSINLFLIRPQKVPNHFDPIAIMPLNHNEKNHPFQREGGGQKYFY